MTDGPRPTILSRRWLPAAVGLIVVLSATGAAASALATRGPDATDLPHIETVRPLSTPVSVDAPAGVGPTLPVFPPPPMPPMPYDLHPDDAAAPGPGTHSGDATAQEADDDDADETREVVAPPVREENDHDEDPDSDNDESLDEQKRESTSQKNAPSDND